MNLDDVPQRETGMTPYEMMLSESQERMLIVVKKGREQEIVDLFEKYGLEAVTMVKVTDDKMLRLIHKGEIVAEVPVDALQKKHQFIINHQQNQHILLSSKQMKTEIPEVEDYKETLLSLLQQPTIASKEWVYDQYDYHGAHKHSRYTRFGCSGCTCSRHRKRISNDDRL